MAHSKHPSTTRVGRLVLPSALALALLGALGCARQGSPPASAASSESARERAVFVSDDGRTLRLPDLRGKPVVIAPFFVSCTVRCPHTVAKLKQMARSFARRGIDARFVLFTIDPENDDEARLRSYRLAHELPSDWLLLRTDYSSTVALSSWIGAHAAHDRGHIVHAATIAILDADGRRSEGLAGWDFDEDAVLAGR
jgi:protein SCO1/2